MRLNLTQILVFWVAVSNFRGWGILGVNPPLSHVGPRLGWSFHPEVTPAHDSNKKLIFILELAVPVTSVEIAALDERFRRSTPANNGVKQSFVIHVQRETGVHLAGGIRSNDDPPSAAV